jgi:hypothetical protein
MTFSATLNLSKGLRCLETRRCRVDFDFGRSRRSLAAELIKQEDVFAINVLKVKTYSLTWRVVMMTEPTVGPELEPTLGAASSNLVEMSP